MATVAAEMVNFCRDYKRYKGLLFALLLSFLMLTLLVGHGHAATLRGQSFIISQTDKNKHVPARPKAGHRRRR